MTRRVSIHRRVLGTLLALCTLLAQAAAQSAACGSAIQTAEVNGATVHYFECGQGEPLVFVHGGLGDLNTFREPLETFAKEFRVIAYSRRFHPPNAPPQAGDAYAMQLPVADLTALVRELEAGPAHLVGNSYGAYVVLAFAMEYPELVRSLVFGEPRVLPLLSRRSVGEAVRESWNRRVLYLRGGPSSVETRRKGCDV
jgi:pimeloyl-ACP methyl ester carboxylesterase